MIRKAVHTLLANGANVSALVGPRVEPNALHQNTQLPAISYQLDGPQNTSLDGLSGTCRAYLHVACWAKSYASAQDIAEAVRDDLVGQKGTWNSTIVLAVVTDDSRDDYLPPTDATGNGLDPVMVDLRIWYKES